MDIIKTPKTPKKFICEMCHFKCSKKSEWIRHISTRKHNLDINGSNNDIKKDQIPPQKCECGKEYNYYSGLWRHKKKCKLEENTVINENTVIPPHKQDIKALTDLVLELVKSNTELQKQMLDVCKNTNITINSNNKTFNMQVFLNEKCKDAMNLMDFVNSMTLDFSDLEELGELGYVEGISRQMVRKLSEMDIYKRPIHCSDLKRETMYVRDNDVWEKETQLYDNLRKAIKYITKKNGDLMIPWRNAHPQCMNLQHPLNDKYLGIMNEAMGGPGEFSESESKIIRKISKCVTIDKSDF